MAVTESIAALFVLANVWLLSMRSIWNFAFGIVGVAIYGWVFWDARLYGDALLQIFFIAVQLYGWRQWARGLQSDGEIVVERLSPGELGVWLVGIAAATAGWGYAMHRFTDNAAPWADTAIVVLSVAAQLLLTRRKIDNWYLWIAVNLVSIALYVSRGLQVTALLYCVLLGLAVWGLLQWRRAERSHRAAVAA